MPSSPHEITQLLSELQRGDPEAAAKLMPLIYNHLRRIAANQFRRERREHTLQPTELVHEVYLRLIKPGELDCKSRAHFFGIAARAMRQLLVEHARAKATAKRGGDYKRVELNESLIGAPEPLGDLLVLEQALTRLEALDPRQTRIFELRFFGGFSAAETAELLGFGLTTVKDEWTLAKAWLRREIAGEAHAA